MSADVAVEQCKKKRYNTFLAVFTYYSFVPKSEASASNSNSGWSAISLVISFEFLFSDF